MLAQYLLSEREWFSLFLNNMAGSRQLLHDLLQNALWVVHRQDRTRDAGSIVTLAIQWAEGTLSNPLSTGDTQAIRKLRHLFVSTSYRINNFLSMVANTPNCVSLSHRVRESKTRLDDLDSYEICFYYRQFIQDVNFHKTLDLGIFSVLSRPEYRVLGIETVCKISSAVALHKPVHIPASPRMPPIWSTPAAIDEPVAVAK
ncbi:hypothetical protein FPOAC1_009869 [Fusarium poae]|uniref:hypothetical protein n=1 Tax=Fusarium poae TaxID=36050 RepID=UPI001CE72A94|nr:hypothetical protein FPOAC1_009869 [Fusarium poae]KAG8670453.1 hypothetical protein FPOAC1_009869 [Fusarium poae]